ncbi:hypothetical protein WISP_93978 [Willisornis vidua]|uniref:Uncharacterized protein n=1 Tax=Willisornis vidua TaxID=1566151 RepID=A0ABQ9D0T6_9PASS|nr:hypothetical protein WISP_93978 [Willisornis vidua]
MSTPEKEISKRAERGSLSPAPAPWSHEWTLCPDLSSPPPADLQRLSFCADFRRLWTLLARPEIAIPSGTGGSRREVSSSSERSGTVHSGITRGEQTSKLPESFTGENGRLIGERQRASLAAEDRKERVAFSVDFQGNHRSREKLAVQDPSVLSSCMQHRLSSRNERNLPCLIPLLPLPLVPSLALPHSVNKRKREKEKTTVPEAFGKLSARLGWCQAQRSVPLSRYRGRRRTYTPSFTSTLTLCLS